MASEQPNRVLSHLETLEILSQRAREGSISAAIALERALRAQRRESEEVSDAIARILSES